MTDPVAAAAEEAHGEDTIEMNEHDTLKIFQSPLPKNDESETEHSIRELGSTALESYKAADENENTISNVSNLGGSLQLERLMARKDSFKPASNSTDIDSSVAKQADMMNFYNAQKEGGDEFASAKSPRAMSEVGDEKELTKRISYKGICYNKQSSKYRAVVYEKGVSGVETYHIGSYVLKADAALAYDKGMEVLKVSGGSRGRIKNFQSNEEYKRAREKELEDSGFSSGDAGSMTFVHEQIQRRILASQQPRQHAKKSAFKGVSRLSDTSKYSAKISHSAKLYCLGTYQLQSDAALAYDEAAKQLENWKRKLNFESKMDHFEARQQELTQRRNNGEDVELFEVVNARIKQQVDGFASKIMMTAENKEGATRMETKASPRNKTTVGNFSTKTSRFIGVSYMKLQKSYRAQIGIYGKNYCLGDYCLEANAAWAYDKAANSLVQANMIKQNRKTNFETLEAYKEAKEKELFEKGLDARDKDHLPAVTAKAQQYISTFMKKIESSAIPGTNHNDESESKIDLREFSDEDAVEKEMPPSDARSKCSDELLYRHSGPVVNENEHCDDNHRSHVRKRKAQGEAMRKKKNCSTSPQLPQSVINELNARSDALVNKWDPILGDRDWIEPDYEESYRRGIESMLMDSRRTFVEFGDDSKSLLGVASKTSESATSFEYDVDNEYCCESPCTLARSKHAGSKDEAGRIIKLTTIAPVNEPKASSLPLAESLDDWRDSETSSNIEDQESSQQIIPSIDRKNKHNEIHFSAAQPDVGIPCSHESQTDSIASTSKKSEGKKDAPKEHGNSRMGIKSNVSLDERKSQLIPLQPDQTANLPFRARCDVWWELKSTDKGESFQHGKVVAVHFDYISRVMVYEVLPVPAGNDKALLFDEKQLAHAPGSPVYYSSTGLFEDSCSLPRGEVLYCRTSNAGNLNLAIDLRDDLQTEQHRLRSNDTTDEECLERVRSLLQRLDSEILIDRPILKQTGIGRTVKSVSKLLANINEEHATFATSLIEKWKSEMDAPRFYYTLLVFGDDDEPDDIQVINDVPAANIKLRDMGCTSIYFEAKT